MARLQNKVTDGDVTSMSKLLARMVTEVCRCPDDVELTVEQSSHRVILGFSSAECDEGRVIGARGKTIRAIREVVESAARARNIQASVVYFNDRSGPSTT